MTGKMYNGMLFPNLGKGEDKGRIEVIDISRKKQTPASDRLEREIKRLRSVVARLSRAVFVLVCFDIAVAAMVIHLVTK